MILRPRVRDHAYHVFPKAKLGRAIRTERHRLVEWKNVGQARESAELELYDYETDPHETRNIAAMQPQVVSELRAILDKYPEPVNPNEKLNAKPVPQAVGLTLSSPIDFQVVQRSSAKHGSLTITGELAADIAATDLKIEARFLDGKQDSPWLPVTGSVSGRAVAGTIQAPAGGWWRLEVQVVAAGRTLSAGHVEHVGVGEVFVIAGNQTRPITAKSDNNHRAAAWQPSTARSGSSPTTPSRERAEEGEASYRPSPMPSWRMRTFPLGSWPVESEPPVFASGCPRGDLSEPADDRESRPKAARWIVGQ